MGEGRVERHLPFERVANFRDLGGYRTADGRTVRWRRLFRSASLQHMSDADVERARGLGIRTVLDLRRPDEVDHLGVGPFVAAPLRHHRLPLLPEGATEQLNQRHGRGISGERYLDYLNFGSELFVTALKLLADESTHPALFHCTAGKDRTGVIAAFVLDILGVDHETIVEDYALSNLAAGALRQSIRREFEQLQRAGRLPDDAAPPQIVADWCPAPPEAMDGFLKGVRRKFGSSRGYFEAQGVEASTFDRLADALLE